MVKNAFTVDVEDWAQSTLDLSRPISERVVVNTRRLLALLTKCDVRATFFVQGMVAERFPELVAEIAAAGHELGTHGYSHQPVYRLGRERFAAELAHSIALVEAAGGQRVVGHRAPDFSIPPEIPWAWEVLRDSGLRYDSSIFPAPNPRYGTPDAPRQPYSLLDGLLEFPVAVLNLGPLHLPVAGGGYFRVFPYAYTRWGLRRLNARGQSAVLYIHPYDLDERELGQLSSQVPWRLRLTQGMNRGRMKRKLGRLLRDFSFGPLVDLLPQVQRA